MKELKVAKLAWDSQNQSVLVTANHSQSDFLPQGKKVKTFAPIWRKQKDHLNVNQKQQLYSWCIEKRNQIKTHKKENQIQYFCISTFSIILFKYYTQLKMYNLFDVLNKIFKIVLIEIKLA